MILNTGLRTDIPAFYSEWFYNRVRAGFVLVRNPYCPSQVTRYRISPDVVDIMVFCTKNPEPMFRDIGLLSPFMTFWFVTITPYGREIEPCVPDKRLAAGSFLKLSKIVGPRRMSWRYDPVFITERYSVAFHIRQFRRIAELLRGSTEQCVVSFIDLYEKTKRNFPGVRAVTAEEQHTLIGAFSAAAADNGMRIRLCCESGELAGDNVDADGCMSRKVLEHAAGFKLKVPRKKPVRQECSCLLGSDIGSYNTCGHGCLYCYANHDRKSVERNMALHDRYSPFLTGNIREGDIVREARQFSWRDDQGCIFDQA